MPLTAVKIKNAQPQSKAYKLSDGSGGYLLITPAGGKLWRMDYRFAGKRKTLALGQYPEITLADFRKRKEDAKREIAEGIDPSARKKLQKLRLYEAHEIPGRLPNSFTGAVTMVVQALRKRSCPPYTCAARLVTTNI